MAGKRFRVQLAESAAAKASESLRALYPEPDCKLEWNAVSTIPTLLATIELASPEAIPLDHSLGCPDPLDAVLRSAPSRVFRSSFLPI